MREVLLEHIQKRKENNTNDRIKWKQFIGMKVSFVYDEIEGEVEIIDYKNNMLTITYLDNEPFTISTDNFTRCKLGAMLGIISHNYDYEINDIVDTKMSSIKILDKIKVKNGEKYYQKGYKYQCLKDNYIGEISEKDLRREHGCSVCSNKIVVKGINDIATTQPSLTKFFANIEDAFTHTCFSGKRVLMKCPTCHFTKENYINSLTQHGFSCSQCSDGISYPNKILFNILKQLVGIGNFETEKVFNWSKNIFGDEKKKGDKQYDFYLPLYNCIIEAHGIQHYEEIKHDKRRSLKEEQKNDAIKEQLAKENGIEHYIVIDCRKSELDFIKNSILNSEISNIFNLSNLNWNKCEEFALNTRIKEISDLWNSGVKNTKDICKATGLSKSTVRNYLYKGKDVGWNDYVPNSYRSMIGCKNTNKIMVKCIETGDVFESYHELDRKSEEIFGVKLNFRGISRVCDSGEAYKGFHFEKINLDENKIDVNVGRKSKKVEVYKDGICLGLYDGCAEIERISEKTFGVRLMRKNIGSVCNGTSSMYKGYVFKYFSN